MVEALSGPTDLIMGFFTSHLEKVFPRKSLYLCVCDLYYYVAYVLIDVLLINY
jgi:hypothetical protein